jgi:hypothetical protein
MQLAHRRRAVGGRHSIVKRWLVYSLSGPFVSVAIQTLDGQARLSSTHGRRLGSNHARRNSKKLAKTTNVCAIDIFSYCSAMNCQMLSAPMKYSRYAHRIIATATLTSILPHCPSRPNRQQTPLRGGLHVAARRFMGGQSTHLCFLPAFRR